MSVILSTTKLKGANVVWANETLILFPAHPKQTEKHLKYGSHIRHVLTILVDGYKNYLPSGEKEIWKLNVIQRGHIYEDSFDTEDSYHSLINKNKDNVLEHNVCNLYNDILNSATPFRRLIEPTANNDIKLSLKRPKGNGGGIYEDIFSKPARPLKLSTDGQLKEGSVSLDNKIGDDVFSYFTIYGYPSLPQIFRCSYITNVALWKPRSSSKYSNNGNAFYREGEFFIESPTVVKEYIKHGISKKKTEQKWKELTETDHIIINDAFQDLTVVGGDPDTFDYFSIHGSTSLVDNPLGYIKWNLNGEELETVVQHIFPRRGTNYEEQFSLLVKARLHCDICPPRDKVDTKLEKIIKESSSYDEFRRKYLEGK